MIELRVFVCAPVFLLTIILFEIFGHAEKTSRKMPPRYRFSVEEDDTIIAFVKNNQSLSKGIARSRNAEKNQLWATLATEMNVDGEY